MESKTKLFKALADFQQEVPAIYEGSTGYGYKYADLKQILAVINPILKKHKLGFTQLLNNSSLETIVFHTESGENISSSVEIPQEVTLKGMNAFQVLGSAITYYRRYNLLSLLDLEVVDDDWKKAQDSKSEKKEFKDDPNKPWIEQTNIDNLKKLIGEWQHFSIKDVRDKYKVSKVNAELLATLGIN